MRVNGVETISHPYLPPPQKKEPCTLCIKQNPNQMGHRVSIKQKTIKLLEKSL
jgi:hypothetical protein